MVGGSSPLARGLSRRLLLSGRDRRIIPARAGFTSATCDHTPRTRDHPRSRGVYQRRAFLLHSSPGSSPLARGLHNLRDARLLRLRIIPARAGFTPTGSLMSMLITDHPRSRGVYVRSMILLGSRLGSSPLARGLLPNSNGDRVVVGIIPARAGFTPDQKDLEAYITDHPRSRGVYDDAVASHHFHPGSSPLARGLRPRGGHEGDWERIIPARAGFTLEDPWNPNDESPYQTAFTFTADLALAPQSSDSAAVAQRSTRPPSEA